jgi:ATP-dependent helicase HrpA
LREGQISELLRALPKTLRRELMPFPPKITEIVRDLQPASDTLQEDLARFIRQRYGIEIPPNAWAADAVPAHLRPRVEVIGPDKKTMGASRDLNELREKLEKEKPKVAAVAPETDPAWKSLAQKWEKFGVTDWSFGDLPERLTVSESGAIPVYAWPGLPADARITSTFNSSAIKRRPGAPVWPDFNNLCLSNYKRIWRGCKRICGRSRAWMR